MQVAGLSCVVGTFVCAGTAYADVTIIQSVTGKNPGQHTTRIKGNKMRIETQGGDNTVTILMDLDAQQMIMLDDKKKEAMVMPVAQIQEAMGKAGSTMSIKSKVTPTAEKKQVAGYSCTVYDVAIAVPFMATESGESAMTLTMSGPACLSKDVPGQSEFARLYKTAAEKGFVFGDPRAAKGPGASMAKGMAELQKQLADAGLPVEQTTNVALEGSGPMVGMMNRMIKNTTTTTLVKVEQGDVAADLFVVPAGYKVKKP